jgi:hypothetical protein
MSFATSNNMPLESYSVLQPSTNAASYSGSQENIIRWIIPANSGYIDFHTSYLKLDLELQNTNYKMSFTNDCGSLNLIQYLRISANGTTIEEIFDAHVLANVLKCYGESHSVRQRRAVQDYASYNNVQTNSAFGTGDSDNELGVPPLNGLGTSENAMNRSMELLLYLDYSGLLSSKTVVPLIGTGDLEIEIRLNKPQNCLRVFPPTKRTDFNVCNGVFDAATQKWGDLAAADTNIFLRPPFNSFSCAADSPFAVGMTVDVMENGVSKKVAKISSIEETNDGKFKLGLDAAVGAVISVDDAHIKITKGIDDNAAPRTDTDYSITRADWYLGIVKPDPSYTQMVASQIEGEGMIMDIATYRTFKSPVMKEVQQQSFQIPAYMSRVKGIITVPIDNQQTVTWTVANTSDYQASGSYEQLKSYQHQSENLFYPTQPVDLTAFIGNGTFSTKASSEHIHQVDQALHACDMDFRTLTKVKENFIVPRAFSKYNATTNLTGTGARLYLNYDSPSYPSKNLIANSYACANTRLVIGQNGVEVFV